MNVNTWTLHKWQVRQALFALPAQRWLVFKPYNHSEPVGRFATFDEALDFANENAWGGIKATMEWLLQQGHYQPAYRTSGV